MAGTDTPAAYLYPGFSLHDELALLVQAGLTPFEALRAASRFSPLPPRPSANTLPRA
jgi:imidazolonepropionase-like amidohydrolase